MRRLQEGPKALQTALGLHEALRRLGADASEIFLVVGDPVCVRYLGADFVCGPAEGDTCAAWSSMMELWNSPLDTGQQDLWSAWERTVDTLRLVITVKALRSRLATPAEA
jgi:hypothetical protein